MNQTAAARITELSCWKNDIEIEPLSGGMTNLNFKVTDGGDQFVVRFGEDARMRLPAARPLSGLALARNWYITKPASW
jgi:aminoglycoside phosphotransferase (APT) family kinase protein